MKICEVEDCERNATARGMCDTHYQRWRRTGTAQDASASDRAPAARPGSEAFYAYLDYLAARPDGDDPARWGERSDLLGRWHARDPEVEPPTGTEADRFIAMRAMRGLAPRELERRARDVGLDVLADELVQAAKLSNGQRQPTLVRHACNRIIEALVP